jgi:hypothetical protein
MGGARAAISPDPRFEVRELAEIDMVSTALDLVTRDDARPAFPAVHLEGRAVLSHSELPADR